MPLLTSGHRPAQLCSESEATHERVSKLGPFLKGEMRFYNLDILDESNP